MENKRGAVCTTLKKGEALLIGEFIEVYINDKNYNENVRLVIVAPKNIRISREKHDRVLDAVDDRR